MTSANNHLQNMSSRSSMSHDNSEQQQTDDTMPLNKIKKPILARTVLWFVTFFGFAVDHMIRININIGIVDMIIPDNNFPNVSNSTHVRRSFERAIMDELLHIEYHRDGFDWNEHDQALLLGAFFWLYWITQIPGGILTRKYGPKKVFGLSILTASLLCFLMPAFAFIHHKLLIGLRALQGLICGLSTPAVHAMIGRWVPPDERSKFITVYHGTAIGIAISYPLFGFIISLTSWEWIYYISGVIGSIWFIFWQYFVYDSPAQHPRCSREEQDYIHKCLGDSYDEECSLSTPWIQIIKSPYIWIIAIAQWGSSWCSSTLLTQGPTYFTRIHHFSMIWVGILTGVPHLLEFIFAHIFSEFADNFIRKGTLTTASVRKIAGTVGSCLQGLFTIALALFGNVGHMAIVWFFCAATVHGAISSGPIASLIDLSPNFSGITMGMVAMFSASTMFISPHVVSAFTLHKQNVLQWKYVFMIAGLIGIICAIPYTMFASSKVQKWNGPKLLCTGHVENQTSDPNDVMVDNSDTCGITSGEQSDKKLEVTQF